MSVPTMTETTAADCRTTSPAHLAGKYMTFKLAAEEYGLEILRVREIIGRMNITRVPRTRDFIRGIINLRGKIIPVVDLRPQFGMSPAEPTDQTAIIVVQVEVAGRPLTMGLLVDQVMEVLSIKAANIEPTPKLGSAAADIPFILGVGIQEERVVLLLDIGEVLGADAAMEVADIVTPSGPPSRIAQIAEATV